MRTLPFLLASLLGWVVAHLLGGVDRKESALAGWMRLAHYPVGIAGASIGTWVSQNSAMLYNKVFLMGIFFSSLTVLLYKTAFRLLAARRKSVAP
ncbi:MAG: hypothetical protein ALAOOOJD_03413 [bacterium]|nr:hypothetical protein [bacterium]